MGSYLTKEHHVGRAPNCAFGLAPESWQCVLVDEMLED